MNYETLFIMMPSLNEEDVKKLVEEARKVILQKNSSIISEKLWGKRTLAYEIKKQKEGIYYYIKFATQDSTVPRELSVFYKQNPSILRFLTVKLDEKNKK